MSDEEYEEIYQNALRTLDLFGARVGRPFTKNGQRLCAINSEPRNDQEIFFVTWGRERAERIRKARMGGKAFSNPALKATLLPPEMQHGGLKRTA